MLQFRELSCIKKDQLIQGAWYRGSGRNSHIALWDGDYFHTFGWKFKQYVEKIEQHWDDGGPFQPFETL